MTTHLDLAEAIRDGSDAMDEDLTALHEQAPQRGGKALCWLTRRGRWLLVSLTSNRSGPVIVISVWAETSFGERFPIKDATYELPTYQLPVLGRAVAKAIIACQTSITERLDARQRGER